MNILFDQGTPAFLKDILANHYVRTVFEMGWSDMENGALLAIAEDSFSIFITNRSTTSLSAEPRWKKLAILVLGTTSWPRIRKQLSKVTEAVDEMTAATIARSASTGEVIIHGLKFRDPIIASGIRGT